MPYVDTPHSHAWVIHSLLCLECNKVEFMDGQLTGNEGAYYKWNDITNEWNDLTTDGSNEDPFEEVEE